MNEEKKEIIDVDEEKKEKFVIGEDESAESEERSEERINEIFKKIETVIEEQREEKELIRKLVDEIYNTFSKMPREEIKKKEDFNLNEFIERM